MFRRSLPGGGTIPVERQTTSVQLSSSGGTSGKGWSLLSTIALFDTVMLWFCQLLMFWLHALVLWRISEVIGNLSWLCNRVLSSPWLRMLHFCKSMFGGWHIIVLLEDVLVPVSRPISSWCWKSVIRVYRYAHLLLLDLYVNPCMWSQWLEHDGTAVGWPTIQLRINRVFQVGQMQTVHDMHVLIMSSSIFSTFPCSYCISQSDTNGCYCNCHSATIVSSSSSCCIVIFLVADYSG